MLQGDSVAIIDDGISFGGGNLGMYGINSNTSASGFLKCLFRKIKTKHNATGEEAAIKSSNSENE